MNPIENLWGYLVCELCQGRTQDGGHFNARDANNANELFQFVNQKWAELANDQPYLQALIDSMPNRLQAVIDQQGGWTRI
jgi:hypothetical protein